MDFDDLLLRAVDLLGSHESVREAYRRRFRYVLVDEYQDTNRAQYELIRHLVGPQGNVTVVGDEDQSIYSWRGADIQNILDFERDFPGRACAAPGAELPLVARRSSTPPRPWSPTTSSARGRPCVAVKTGGEPVRLHQAGDEYQEAAWVVSRLAARRRDGRAAILFRMNAQSRLLEEALMRQGLPYQVLGGVGFYERREVKDLLAYLRLVRNPRDPVALRRVLNVPPAGDRGPHAGGDRAGGGRGAAISLWEALARGGRRGAAARPGHPAPAALPGDARARCRGRRRGWGSRTCLSRILEATGYSAALAQEDSQESQDRLENLAELLSAAADYEARRTSPSLAGFLDQVVAALRRGPGEGRRARSS